MPRLLPVFTAVYWALRSLPSLPPGSLTAACLVSRGLLSGSPVSGPWSQGTANHVQECLLNRHELTEGNGTTQLTFQAVPNTHQWAAQAHFTVAKQPQLATLI